jgi:hypothetical protein
MVSMLAVLGLASLSACGSSGSNVAVTPTTIAPATTTRPPAGGSGFGSVEGTVPPALAGGTLLRLDSPGNDPRANCSNVVAGTPNYPKWAVNAIAVVQCAPSSLPGGGAIGLIFASDDDLHSSLSGYNDTLRINVDSAGSKCPPASGDPYGVVVGGGKGGATSVLECRRFEGDNRPVFIWTSLANHELWVAEGSVGMSDAALAAWWHTNAN